MDLIFFQKKFQCNALINFSFFHLTVSIIFCSSDHILSHHAQRDIPMVTQLLCTLPQLPPALNKSETVLLIGGCGVMRVSGGSKAVDLLKWAPTEKRTALDGQIRRGNRRVRTGLKSSEVRNFQENNIHE